MAVAAAYLQANTTRTHWLAKWTTTKIDKEAGEADVQASSTFTFQSSSSNGQNEMRKGKLRLRERGSWRESSEFAAGHCRELSTERAETIERARECRAAQLNSGKLCRPCTSNSSRPRTWLNVCLHMATTQPSTTKNGADVTEKQQEENKETAKERT